MATKILKSLFILILVSTFFGCASEEKNANTPEGLFAIAKEYDEAERYEIALQKYADVKNKFPYSSLATSAELAVADVHFKRESFAEAQIAYQNFRDLQSQLEGTENRITVARNRHIDAIKLFNNEVTVPPSSWTNSLFYKFEKAPQWTVENAKELEAAPAVKF